MRLSRTVFDVPGSPLPQEEGTTFFSTIEKFCSFILPLISYYFSLSTIANIISRFRYEDLIYSIDEYIVSPATEIMFTHSKRTNLPICLKIWQPWKDTLYNTEDIQQCTEYLLEGLAFNRKFAKWVYLGIAHVEKREDRNIHRGKLIAHPKKNKLNMGVRYGLVMKRLQKSWRLDEQLCSGKSSTKKGMEFLAEEIAHMHVRLEKSPSDYGTPEKINEKMQLNRDLLKQALVRLIEQKMDITNYKLLGDILERAFCKLEQEFRQRYESGHIKRCHGDLKSPNLWIAPRNLFRWKTQLLPLDCVDFRPDFCHIDTLSDIAMLVVDIEARFPQWQDEQTKMQCTKSPAQHFLGIYLAKVEKRLAEDRSTIEAMLEYYLTEKAIVCGSISILYDEVPELGKRYLDLAVSHAENLQQKISVSMRPLPDPINNVRKPAVPVHSR